MNAKAKILVIDDDELVLATIKSILMRARYDVALASDGNEGIAHLLHGHFDLVLCDMVMPEEDGLDTLIGLKALAPAIPVIMMASGPTSQGAFDETGLGYLGTALAVGAAVIEKPFCGASLVAKIYDCLVHRSAHIH
jgi:CheY-like chemotaxis protein